MKDVKAAMNPRTLLFALLSIFILGQSPQAGDRSQVIDFEDEVIEGLNKKPLDSLSQISERDRKRRQFHLYRKRAGFTTETQELLREVRYYQ